jgi:hypothetical protein
MAASVFNISKGRVVEFANRVDVSDPTNAVFVVVALNSTATHATLRDLDTLALVIADVNTVEAANTGYARIVLDQDDITTISPDDANDRFDVDLADFEFGAITDDDVDWTHLVLCYDSDSTGGTDTNIVPMLLFDFAVTIDGSAVTAQVNASGVFRAS